MSTAVLLVIASVLMSGPQPAPTPGALLLDTDTRADFLRRWEPAHVSLRFHPPAAAMWDPSFRTGRQVHGFVAADADGSRYVVAPVRALAGVRNVQVVFAHGATTRARVLPPERADQVPLARLAVEDPSMLTGLAALPWATDDLFVDGARGWLVERPMGVGPLGGQFDAVLVDTVVGPPVEAPLSRFRYLRLRNATGLPVLDTRGAILCVVFREVATGDGRSLCTPGSAAFTARPPAEQP